MGIFCSFSGNRRNQHPTHRGRQSENHPPVGANGHGPKSFELTFERMQPKSGDIHIRNPPGCIESR
jgi:hypothetical protein